jgi:signal transduction histidine kinase
MRDTSLVEELMLVPEFSDLPVEHLAWLASQADDYRFHPGEVLIHEGDEANVFSVLLEGEIRYRRDSAGVNSPLVISRAPEIGGMLPLSRMKIFSVTVTALTEGRMAVFPTAVFPEMLSRMPELNRRLAAIMSDRIREVTELEQQHEKLLAISKLASGLAHELNNPAAAARRAARGVSNALRAIRESTFRLGQLDYPGFAWQLLFDYEQAALSKPAVALSGMNRMDREERVTAWMHGHGVTEAWTIAAAMADWDVDVAELDHLAAKCPAKFLPEVLVHICSVLTAERLLADVHNSLIRISSLVSAVKDYSYMDQQQVQEIDLHEGLENTLAMLGSRLEGVSVVRNYDRALPRICAHGSALNQVWTNIISNSLDAMDDAAKDNKNGRILRVRTACEVDTALVEITDNGCGVPKEIQGRIFEPFFTTKAVGQGMGLGLDMARKLLWNLNGSISCESEPGYTSFSVRIPFSQAIKPE